MKKRRCKNCYWQKICFGYKAKYDTGFAVEYTAENCPQFAYISWWKIKPKFWKYICLLALTLTIFGCDSQSPNVRFVDGMGVHLWYESQITNHPAQLDIWCVNARFDNDIYCAAFGYLIQVKSINDDVGVAGIRVDCYITNHHDPENGDNDIWGDQTLNGDQYGFVKACSEFGNSWNAEEGHAVGITTEEGIVSFWVGLGSPRIAYDADYLWPSGSILITTVVELRFVIRKNGGDIIKNVHCAFYRNQYGGFWLPNGYGVYDLSYQSLEPYSGWPMANSMFMDINSPNSIADTNIEPRNLASVTHSSIAEDRVFQKMSQNDGDSNNLWTYEKVGWCQYRWDDYWGQYDWMILGDDVLHSLVSPNNTDEAVAMMSLCEPYGFLYWITLEGVRFVPARYHTVTLESKTAEGQVVSRTWVWTGPYLYWSHNEVLMMTEFIVPVDSPAGEGKYFDMWGYPGTFIYVPEGGYLELKLPDFYGDFNYDNKVDYQDLTMFGEHWQSDILNYGYDLRYDSTQDGRTNEIDLLVFADNWLKERPVISYGDFNYDNSVNYKDLAMLSKHWNQSVDANSKFDATHDGLINENDLMIFMKNWLRVIL